MHDYHLHTNYSIDSESSMESMILAAIKEGLTEIAFTDHIDFSFNHTSICYDIYLSELTTLREKYASKISIILGVELGLGPKANAKSSELINKYPFDFVIGSTHDVDALDLYKQDYFENKSKYDAYTHYLEEMITNVKTFDDFCVYGHLDYIIRYGIYDNNNLAYEDYSEHIDALLKVLIEHGKGIEVNTSGFRYNLNDTHPKRDIVKRYVELGGEILTVGSDAHSPEYIGSHFDYVKDMLKSFGVKYICNFRNRKPVFVLID